MITALLAATFLSAAAPPPAPTPKTLRVDYYHTGNATEEHFSLDRVVLEPGAWPGNPAGRSTTPTSASTCSR